MKSISPNCQAAKKSLKISTTSSSNSLRGSLNSEDVTNPMGLNLSPILNECPALDIAKSDISNNVDPIPTAVEADPTFKLSNRFSPVSVVLPTPSLETPTMGISS